MAANWGYALAIDGPLDGGGLQKQLANPKSVTARCVALAAQFPDKFKLQVNLDRDFPTDLSDGFYVTNSRGWFVDDHTNTWQYATNKQYTESSVRRGPTATGSPPPNTGWRPCAPCNPTPPLPLS